MKLPRRKAPANKKSHKHIQKIWGFYNVADNKWLSMGADPKRIQSIISTHGKKEVLDLYGLSNDFIVRQRLINHHPPIPLRS